MALYLIAFNDEWVPDLTLEEVRERGASGRAVIEEMTAASVFVFSDGGLDASTAVCSVDPSSGSPGLTRGPFPETKEHPRGFARRRGPPACAAAASGAPDVRAVCGAPVRAPLPTPLRSPRPP